MEVRRVPSDSRSMRGSVTHLREASQSLGRELAKEEAELKREEAALERKRARANAIRADKRTIDLMIARLSLKRRSSRTMKRALTDEEKLSIRRKFRARKSDEAWKSALPALARSLHVTDRQVISVIAGIRRKERAKSARGQSGAHLQAVPSA